MEEIIDLVLEGHEPLVAAQLGPADAPGDESTQITRRKKSCIEAGSRDFFNAAGMNAVGAHQSPLYLSVKLAPYPL